MQRRLSFEHRETSSQFTHSHYISKCKGDPLLNTGTLQHTCSRILPVLITLAIVLPNSFAAQKALDLKAPDRQRQSKVLLVTMCEQFGLVIE